MKKHILKPLYTKLLAIIIISFLGIIIYSNTFNCSFQFDDLHYIVENSFIRTFQNFLTHWQFYPCRFIPFLSIAINYHFSGLNVFSYHVFNLIVHLASAILVWWLTLLTLSTPAMKENKITQHVNLIALFAGLVFVSHPLQTEAVTFIWQRTASMAAMFYLASLCLYVKSRLLATSGDHNGRPYYIFSLIMAVAAMFTKENSITLPLMIVLHEFCFFDVGKEPVFSRMKWPYLTPFLLTLFIIPLTILLTKSGGFLENQGFVTPSGLLLSPWQYLLTQFRVIVTYIRLLFLPLNQNLDYNYPISKSIFEGPTLLSLLFIISILYSAKKLLLKYRLISFCIFWFFLSLSIESSLLPLQDVIFEHRLYLPLVGYSIFLVSSMYYFLGENATKKMMIVLSIIITFNSILTFQRNNVWKDEITLWSDTVQKSPNKARPNYDLGLAYYKSGNIIQSILNYNKAIKIKPNYVEAHYNLGLSYYKLGLLSPSNLEYNKTIEIDPNFVNAYINRGNNYIMKGNLPQALSDYNKAIEINPNIPEAYYSRGSVYVKQNNLAPAILEYNKAIKINPNYVGAYLNRGNTYLMQDNFTQALSDYNKIIEINPHFTMAYYNRGCLYDKQGNLTEALSNYNKAIDINSNYTPAYLKRAVILYLLNEYDKALNDVYMAEALGGTFNPGFINTLKNKSGQNK